MKKLVQLGLVLSCGLLLAACGDGGSKDTSKESGTNTSSKKESATSKSSEKAESTGDFVKSADDATFDGTTLKGNDYTIKITSHKVIQPGEAGNEYGDKPVIAFWYDTIVNPDYNNEIPVKPSVAWISSFKAVQDNNANLENKLAVATLPDNNFLETQIAEIKPGGTVPNAVAYTLSDTETPVTLYAQNILGKEFGKADFPVK